MNWNLLRPVKEGARSVSLRLAAAGIFLVAISATANALRFDTFGWLIHEISVSVVVSESLRGRRELSRDGIITATMRVIDDLAAEHVLKVDVQEAQSEQFCQHKVAPEVLYPPPFEVQIMAEPVEQTESRDLTITVHTCREKQLRTGSEPWSERFSSREVLEAQCPVSGCLDRKIAESLTDFFGEILQGDCQLRHGYYRWAKRNQDLSPGQSSKSVIEPMCKLRNRP